ncbi:MAG: hypothetical protein AB7O38_30570 [Pirellulaceae bacterium]
MTATGAVLRGHMMVTLPVAAAMACGFLIGRFVVQSPQGGVGLLAGTAVAWLLWSFQVPRWRDWVEANGISPEAVQRLAVRTGLLWPRGSLMERTEFRRRDGRRGW